MVSNTHAIVDPGAVMVEPFNAVVADGTVAAATRTNREAIRAQLCTVNVLEHVEEVDFFILEVAGLGAGGTEEKEEAEQG